MIIRNIEPSDLIELARLHKMIFGKSHFSSTFPEKILRMYFEELLKHNEFKLAAVEGHEIIGYLIAGYDPDTAVKNFMKKKRFHLIFILLSNPSFLLEKIKDILKASAAGSESVHKKNISIYLVAVKTEKQKLGIGKKMLEHFEKLLSDKGIDRYTLAVRKNNISAIDFYRRYNFNEISRDHKTISFIKILTDG